MTGDMVPVGAPPAHNRSAVEGLDEHQFVCESAAAFKTKLFNGGTDRIVGGSN